MAATTHRNIQHLRLGKLPLVILPLAQWQEVEAILEDYEMVRSVAFRESIAAARKQIKQGKSYKLDLKTGKFVKAPRR